MRTRSYEAMFLLDNQAAQADWDATSGKVDTILEKHGARIVQKEKWDERKLAYEIKGLKRATYMLVWFRAEPRVTAELELQLRLEERVIRHMLLTHESEPPGVGQSAEDFEAAAPPPPERY